MCKPISFVSNGKGKFYHFNLEQRKDLLNNKIIDKPGNIISIDQADSHTSIATFFHLNDDKVNKYEFDFVTNKVIIDQINTTDDSVAAQQFAENTLRPFIKELVNTKDVNLLWKVIPHILNQTNCIKFAIFCAELVLPIYKNKFPNDDRPRKAINAAKACLKNPTKENAYAANAANAAKIANAAVNKQDIINKGLELFNEQ